MIMLMFILQAMPGVLTYLDHRAIPGTNSCVTDGVVEPIFAFDKISFAGQAIGVVLAETADQARKAARAVDISYTNKQRPILTIRDALQSPNNILNGKPVPLQTGTQDLKGNNN